MYICISLLAGVLLAGNLLGRNHHAGQLQQVQCQAGDPSFDHAIFNELSKTVPGIMAELLFHLRKMKLLVKHLF
jgi:hypothetical protein